MDDATQYSYIGKGIARVDAAEKITGQAQYINDMGFHEMLYAAICTAGVPHAELVSLDVSKAEEIPGVMAVLTADHIPGQNQVGCVFQDQPLLVKDRVRMCSDRIALVAAKTENTARKAVAAIEIQLKELPVVSDPIYALTEQAFKIHEKGNLVDHRQVIKGDVEKGFSESDLVLEESYHTGYQEHAYLEPQGVIAHYNNGVMDIFASCQCPFYILSAVARVLGLSENKVHVVQTTTGGAFGGKEDYPSELACCAALLSYVTQKPVKLIYNRTEDMLWSSKRHPMTMKYKLGAKSDGTFTAAQVDIYVDSGAYAGLSTVVAERSNSCCIGPYKIPNVLVNTYIVSTNNLFSGAFRGFGAPQVTFAAESHIDLLADKLSIDPWDIRKKNLVEVDDETITSQVLLDSVSAVEVMNRAYEMSQWDEKRAAFFEHNQTHRWLKKGIGVANVMYGCCLHYGGQHLEGSAAYIHIRKDATVAVSIGGTDIGQGAFTVIAQIVAEALGFPIEVIHIMPVDTNCVADSGPTVASRTTIMSGNAAIDAANLLGERMQLVAADLLLTEIEKIEFRNGEVFVADKPTKTSYKKIIQECYKRKVNLSASGWYSPTRKTFDQSLGQGEAYSVYTFGTQVAEVSVDLLSGRVSVQKVYAVHDIGKVINPVLATGQVEGGVCQGLGYALMEEMVVENGRLVNPNFTDYLIPTALDVPEIEIDFIENPYYYGPYYAKGIGEPALIPTAAAIANAVKNATSKMHTSLPITPEKVISFS